MHDFDLDSTDWLSICLDVPMRDHYVSTVAHGAYMATPADAPAKAMYRFIADAYSIWEDE